MEKYWRQMIVIVTVTVYRKQVKIDSDGDIGS
jgi:hypothetical protein